MATYYAIRIHTDSTSTLDESIGLRYGYFQWITGDPGYDGSIVLTGDVPVSADGQVWYSGIISKNGIGKASRRINIENVGSYGSESDFEFQVNNTAGFWNVIKSQDIYLINRKVELFVVINHVFYLWWTGVIENNPFDEMNFKFRCMDSFRKLHKVIPPNTIDDIQFPNAVESSYGQRIPVTIGKVPKAKVTNISGRPTRVSTGVYNGNNVYYSPAGRYVTPENGNPYIELFTYGKSFEASDLGSGMFYLKGVKGTTQSVQIVENAATGFYIRNFTRVYLASPLDGVSDPTQYFISATDFTRPSSDSKGVSIYSLSATPGGGWTNSGVWYFEIVSLPCDYLVSNREIQSLEANDYGLTELLNYSTEEDSYQDVSELVLDTELSTSGQYQHPTVSIGSKRFEKDGEFSWMVPIAPSKVTNNFTGSLAFGTVISAFATSSSTQDMPEIHDRDRSTYRVGILSAGAHFFISHFIHFPYENISTEFSELYLAIDCDISASVPFRVSASVEALDQFGLTYRTQAVPQFGNPFTSADHYSPGSLRFNTITDEYYRAGGNTNSEPTKWGYSQTENGLPVSYKQKFRVDSDIVEGIQDTSVSQIFAFDLNIKTSARALSNIEVKVKDYGFIQKKTINVFSEDLFVKVQGEKLSGSYVEYVPPIFRLIMEGYDGIHSSQVDISEISATHSDWTIGRQLSDPASSYDYLNDLASKTFIGIVPTRRGYRKLRPWRSLTTPIATDSQNNILRNSISEFKGSELRNLFNDLEVYYDWNPGSKKHDKILTIKKVDEASFPSPYISTGSETHLSATQARALSLADQGTYIVRIPGHTLSIGDMLSLSGDTNGFNFEFSEVVSMSGSDVTVLIGEVPYDQPWTAITGTLLRHSSRVPLWTTYAGGIQTWAIGEYLWGLCHASYQRTLSINPLPKDYSEVDWFIDESKFSGIVSDESNTALKYLTHIAEWTTRQKDVVNYSLPVSTSYLSRELLDPINFQDTYFTSGSNRQGWITMLDLDPKNDALKIELTLNPEEVDLINIIDEANGNNSTIYDEANGNNTDLIFEE